MTALRPDIQTLRGVAVSLSVAHHVKVPPFKADCGVDIFFVISGFLTTSLIAQGVRTGTSSFADFYWRCARCLLPAAYATIAACVALAPFLLTELETRDFVRQVVGTVTFTANMVLWLQKGCQ